MRTLPWLLVKARIRKNFLHFLQVALVLGFALLALLSIQGISGATGKALVSYSLSKLPAGEANFTINSSQVISSPEQRETISRYLGKNLLGITTGAVTPEIIFSELVDTHGVRFYYGAVDQLSEKIKLVSGRIPATCTPKFCEVVQIGGTQKLPPRPASFGISVVGSAQIAGDLIFAGTMGPPAGTPLLLTQGIGQATALTAFAALHGSNGWVGTLDLKKIDQVGADAFSARVVAFQDQLSIDYPNLIVTWPQDSLSTASDQAKSVQGKLTLLKFAVVTLLLAFITLIAFRRRGDHALFRAALSRIGTPKRTLAWENYLEGAAPLFFGGLVALFLSYLLPKLLLLFNFRIGLADLFVGWPTLLALVLVLLALSVAITVSRDSAWRRTQLISAVLTLVLFAFYLIQSHVNDSRYMFIPIIYTGVPLLLTYLLLRGAERLWRFRREELFILLKEFFSMWLGVAATVALTVLLATLALGYSSGLSQEISTQARNEVPLDISLVTGLNLIRPFDLASAADYSKLQPGSEVFPILRTGTSIRGQSSASDSLSLIGVSATALSLAVPSLVTFANSRAFQSAAPEGGIGVGSTKSILVRLKGIPKEVELLGWFRTPRGTHTSKTFAGQSETRALQLGGVIPAGSSLVAFEFRESSNYLSRRLHANGEGNFSVPQLKGIGSITALLFDKSKVELLPSIWDSSNFPYRFDGQSLYLAPKRDLGIPSVVTDPATASLAVSGNLTLLASGNSYMKVRVGKVVKSFPSAGDRFVVMELGSMQAEIAKNDIAAIDPIELWIKSPNPESFSQQLSNSPYQGVEIKNRVSLEKIARDDPNSVGLLASYRIALALALLFALLIALGAPRSVYLEGREVLRHLEVIGFGPKDLRTALLTTWRSAILAGIFVGSLVGVITSRALLSSSIPFVQEVVVLLVAYLCVELLGKILTRGFFKERLMVP